MEIFKTSDDSYYDQLVTMGPAWLAEFKEMDANYRFAAWTLELMEHFLNMLVNNQFPMQCDLKTLEKFEKLLKIEYNNSPNEEERRRTVATFWAATGKMSKSLIHNIVKEYTCSDENGNVFWDDETLVIDFDNTITSNVELSMLQRIIRRLMPAHIPFLIRCMCSVYVGVSPKREYLKHLFDLAGTIPGVNIGLAKYENGLVNEVSAHGWNTTFPLCGTESI